MRMFAVHPWIKKGIVAIAVAAGNSYFSTSMAALRDHIAATEQARAVGELSRDYARSTVDLTDRQNIQLHWVRIEDVPEIWQRLDDAGRPSLGHLRADIGHVAADTSPECVV